MHELAHTLDLGHTPHGIMARGFEDMHVFFTTSKLTSDYLPQSPHHRYDEKVARNYILSVDFNVDK